MRRGEQGSTTFLSLRERFFVPFAVETIGVLGQAYTELVKELGGRLKARTGGTGDKRETVWLKGCGCPARLGGHIPWFGARVATAKQATELLSSVGNVPTWDP